MTLRVLAALLAALLVAQNAAAQQINFVACPVVRDTRTVPCFLAEYQGETYYLAVQQDISADQYPPQLLHDVLVEGTIDKGPRVCGGIPLKPVKLSVMPEVNPACNTILPAEPGIDAPPTRRPAGPSTRQAPVTPTAAPAAPQRPTPPFTEREWKILYDFDSAFLFSRDTRTVNQAADYAVASKAKHIEVVAQRGATLLSNGKVIVEGEAIAAQRADRVASLLKGLGADATSVNVRVVSTPPQPDGKTDPENRVVSIRVSP
jgi:outer membrane protein OmpA-like peptidoglycan-associated protein